jgi:integrase/recombinase XerC
MFSEYIAYLENNDRSKLTIEAYTIDMYAFAKWFFQTNGETLNPQNITTSDIREHRQYLQVQKNKSPSTVNRRLAAIKAYIRWAEETKQIEYNPAKSIHGIKEQEVAPHWLTRQHQASIIREAEKRINKANSPARKTEAIRDYCIVTILLNTGLRVAEFCSLTIKDISLSDRKGLIIVKNGKGGKNRQVPLNLAARNAINLWLNTRIGGNDQLFYGMRGGLQPRGVQEILRKIGEGAHIELTPHQCRHSFAKNLVDAQISLEKVAGLLGHTQLNTTKIYITPSQLDLEKAVGMLDN